MSDFYGGPGLGFNVVRWQFYDPSSGTYTFAINPNEGGTPKYQRNLLEVSTTAAEGRTLLFEGADAPAEVEFSGILYNQADLEALVAWSKKHRQIRVTDDMQRQFWIYITNFEATRRRSRQHPWKHNFKISAMILDWTP